MLEVTPFLLAMKSLHDECVCVYLEWLKVEIDHAGITVW